MIGHSAKLAAAQLISIIEGANATPFDVALGSAPTIVEQLDEIGRSLGARKRVTEVATTPGAAAVYLLSLIIVNS